MSEPCNAWKIVDDSPVQVWCPKGMVYPEYDANDQKIYENTHFATREEAVSLLRADITSEINYCGRMVTQARESLAKTEKDAAAAVERAAKVWDALGREAPNA